MSHHNNLTPLRSAGLLKFPHFLRNVRMVPSAGENVLMSCLPCQGMLFFLSSHLIVHTTAFQLGKRAYVILTSSDAEWNGGICLFCVLVRIKSWQVKWRKPILHFKIEFTGSIGQSLQEDGKLTYSDNCVFLGCIWFLCSKYREKNNQRNKKNQQIKSALDRDYL